MKDNRIENLLLNQLEELEKELNKLDPTSIEWTFKKLDVEAKRTEFRNETYKEFIRNLIERRDSSKNDKLSFITFNNMIKSIKKSIDEGTWGEELMRGFKEE